MELRCNLYSRVLFLAGFMLFAVGLNAQSQERLDSILKANTLKMYEDPDQAITAGKLVVRESGSDINLKIRAYKLIADGYSSKRDYEKSLENVIKANQLLPQSKDELLKILIVNKMGIQYHQLKVYDKSIQYLDEAEKLCLDFPIRDSVTTSLGVNYIVRGFIYKEKLNCDIAITYFDRGIKELLRAKDIKGNANKLSIAKYNKGNCYLLMSDTKSATRSFEEAIVHAKIINAKSLLAFAQKGLAQVYTLEGKYNDAIKILQEAIVTAKNVNDLVLNQEIYKGLSENYLAVNQWEKYRTYRFQYLKTQTKLKERERKSVSDSLAEKENEDTLKLQDEKPRFWYAIVFILILSIGVIVLFVLYIKRIKRTIVELDVTIKNLQTNKSVNSDN